jgi:hypothetical protein
MVVKATLMKLRMAEVPIVLYPDGRSRPPHLRSWRDGWRHLRFLLLFSPRWLFLYPGIALMAAGALLGAWIVAGPRPIAGVTLNVNTLMYAAAAIAVGFQSVIFAVFTKSFAINMGLLPVDPRITKLFDVVTLELGLAVGGLLLLLGLAGSIWAFGGWEATSFGELDPIRTLRLVIPSALSLIIGAQLVLSSFFLSVLGLRRGGA